MAARPSTVTTMAGSTLRFAAMARSAALQALAEPLSAILFLVAMATIHLIPVFHYHQFGAAGRLARECGFSVVLVMGLVFAVSAAAKAVGGEISSGTAAAALARPVPRPLFFCARTAGVAAAFVLFLFGAAAGTLLSALTSVVGAHLVAAGAPSHVWPPGLALGLGGTLLALAGAAAANRFWRCRFCVSACLALALVQLPALGLCLLLVPHAAGVVAWEILPPMGLLAMGCGVFLVFSAALSVYLRPAVVSALVSAAVLLSFAAPVRALFPDFARFWLADRIVDGRLPSVGEMSASAAAAVLLMAFWLAVGSCLMSKREIP